MVRGTHGAGGAAVGRRRAGAWRGVQPSRVALAPRLGCRRQPWKALARRRGGGARSAAVAAAPRDQRARGAGVRKAFSPHGVPVLARGGVALATNETARRALPVATVDVVGAAGDDGLGDRAYAIASDVREEHVMSWFKGSSLAAAAVPSPLAAAASAAGATVKHEGTWPEADKPVTLDVTATPRTEALRKLADAAGWSLVVHAPPGDPVDIHVKQQPASKVLDVLLDDGDYVVTRDGTWSRSSLVAPTAIGPHAPPVPACSAAVPPVRALRGPPVASRRLRRPADLGGAAPPPSDGMSIKIGHVPDRRAPRPRLGPHRDGRQRDHREGRDRARRHGVRRQRRHRGRGHRRRHGLRRQRRTSTTAPRPRRRHGVRRQRSRWTRAPRSTAT